MILRCSYEELSALSAGARDVLASADADGGGVAAPPEVLADVEALLERLGGDLSVETLAEQRGLERAVDLVLSHLKQRTDALILERHVGADDAVNSHFEYGHVLRLHERLRRIGNEMEQMVEVMTGGAPTPESAREITFPD